MPTTSELEQFYEFLGQRLSAGEANLSPEDVLKIWRNDSPDLGMADPRTVRAIEEAIEGSVVSLDWTGHTLV